uniref:Uncharacterized protein n=1 Tax=Avena sativa TaxID=4498 RepID=A0ACD5UN09_AVESA
MLAVVAVLLLLLQPVTPFEASDCDGINYSPNSTFQANLKLVAAALPGNASSMPTGFATADAGTSPDRAYAMALCRGDVNASTCDACVSAAFRAAGAEDKCPNNTGATMYEDACVLRFSSVQFLDFLKADQWQPGELTFLTIPAPGKVTTVPGAWFSAAATAILTAVVDHAVGNSTTRRKYFATGEMNFEPRIYALAQCIPDMTLSQCHTCLGTLVDQTMGFVNSTKPRWVMSFMAWCNLRYSVLPFYEGGSMLRLQAPPPPPAVVPPSATPGSGGAGKKRSPAGLSAGIACSVVFILVLGVFAFIGFKRRTNKATHHQHPLKNIAGAQCTIFDLPTLQEATENFSEKNKLGEGGFGIVYKGILPDGQEIAVKKLLETSGHGLQELHNEVLLLAELQHKNLVRLQGFCSHRDDTLLVYEYIKNGSLDNFLFDSREKSTVSWEQQYNIILGIAKGILYLHEDSSMRIIHRDLKPNNILLADDMDPKIADFGLARLLGEGHTHTKTARAAGTLGYMAPEAVPGRVSPKIDIYSFGVLVLEIVTRRRNSSSGDRDTVNLLSDVWNCWTKGTISEMIDQSLEEYARSQALRCIHIGLICVQPDPDDRPNILSVIFMLTRDNMEIQAPAQPAFFFRSESALASLSLYHQSDFILGENASVNGVTVTELYPR